jgi:formate hydrogenlyase subunit 6/NADH:ubiquinone oxidoreductase subunit I
MKGPGKMLPFVLLMASKKPATVLYPFVKVEMPENFRGKLKFDAEKCIGCKLCMKDCPSDAIFIEKLEEKKFKCEVYLDRCVYCGQCADTCPKDALKNSKEYELAGYNRPSLKVNIG